MPSVTVNIYPHRIKLELPFEIIDFLAREGLADFHGEILAAQGRTSFTKGVRNFSHEWYGLRILGYNIFGDDDFTQIRESSAMYFRVVFPFVVLQ